MVGLDPAFLLQIREAMIAQAETPEERAEIRESGERAKQRVWRERLKTANTEAKEVAAENMNAKAYRMVRDVFDEMPEELRTKVEDRDLQRAQDEYESDNFRSAFDILSKLAEAVVDAENNGGR